MFRRRNTTCEPYPACGLIRPQLVVRRTRFATFNEPFSSNFHWNLKILSISRLSIRLRPNATLKRMYINFNNYFKDQFISNTRWILSTVPNSGFFIIADIPIIHSKLCKYWDKLIIMKRLVFIYVYKNNLRSYFLEKSSTVVSFKLAST